MPSRAAPAGFYGTDREGRPIYVQQPGNIDPTELWKFTTLERSVRYHIQQQERYCREVVPASSVAAGRLHEQSLVIIDMEGEAAGGRGLCVVIAVYCMYHGSPGRVRHPLQPAVSNCLQ